MKKIWFDEAWEDYVYWQTQDKKTIKRINMLVKDIERRNFDGIGKPEPLKGELSGFWSRRIDEVSRLVYRVSKNTLEILSCADITRINRNAVTYSMDNHLILLNILFPVFQFQ